MNSDWILYFGYGSLVNRDTRPADEEAHPARLCGWQRIWDHRVTDPNRDQPCTSLSIEPVGERPCDDSDQCAARPGIDGVVVRLPLELLAQLDQREAGYERLAISTSDFELPDELRAELAAAGDNGDTVMVYRSLPLNRGLADKDHPVLQSYIDCVLNGFLHRYGEAGVEAFIGSTYGWERATLNDRADPFYPRWVRVEPVRQQYFDRLLAAYRCV